MSKPENHSDYSLHVLTCHRDVIMTLWALGSFYAVSKIYPKLFIHDDGTLTSTDRTTMQRLFPDSTIVSSKNFVQDYAAALETFPILKRHRQSYHNFSFKKIIDPFVVSDRLIHLIVDSDILWFARPVEIEQTIETGGATSLMQRNNASIAIKLRDGEVLPERFFWFNAGIILYAKKNFDAVRLSELFERLNPADRSNLHFADQFGHAYCLDHLEGLPSDRYMIKGDLHSQVVARHYTSPRRPLFYIEGVAKLKDILLSV